MRHYASLLLAVLGAGWCGLVAAQYQESLRSDNGMYWRGLQGPTEFCPYSTNNSFAYALDFKFDDLNDLDNVGGNGVKLFCRDPDDAITGYVTSLEGKRGDWQGIHSCPKHEFFDGFRLRVFPEQGIWGDDFAVDNIQLSCSDGTIVDGMDGVLPTSRTFMERKKEREEQVEKNVVRKSYEVVGRKMEVIRLRLDKTRIHGDWGSWAYCSPDLYVLGLRTTVEDGHIDDDAGLTDVTLYCG